MKYFSTFLLLILIIPAVAQENLIMNVDGRNQVSLNGNWHYIIDPYETGFYNYRFSERQEDDPEAYWNRPVVNELSERIEHGYHEPYTIKVPGDWNSQAEVFKYYEGTVWYQREFDLPPVKDSEKVVLYFGAVNYEAHVYLNGKKLGMHKGGFTPFNFEVSKSLLQEKNNFLVVKVDNKRHADEIPTLNTDWWNFGGITRDVKLLLLPETYLQQYSLQLDPEQDIKKAHESGKYILSGSIKLNKQSKNSEVTIEIPELKVRKQVEVTGDSANFTLQVKDLQLWSPQNPKLYEVILSIAGNVIQDKIGFRKIEASGKDILLNGEKIFLRGISIHEEIPQEMRRANSREDAARIFEYVQDLNANMVRLAHYPHNENMTRMADSLGVLVWSEIPVYWTIDFENERVLEKAKNQLKEMIIRDRNRASVIIWSVGNETPVSEARTKFMRSLIGTSRKLDDTRLISAALEVTKDDEGVQHVNDPLGQYTDIVAVNEYLGWYGALPDAKESSTWEIAYDKPLFFSETGAGAKAGFHGKKEERWTEEFQKWYYEETIKMLRNMPDNYSGVSPWILMDFRSPRRNHPVYQEGWNRKGLIDNNGNKKLAFDVVKSYYSNMKKASEDKNEKKEQQLIAPGAELKLLADGFDFTEGPATDAEGNVYFTDQPNNKILKWSVQDEKVSVFMENSGRANGLYFDENGNLYAAADNRSELWKISDQKKITIISTGFDGKKFNGPNDLWIAPNGGIYFTDPYYKRPYRNYPEQPIKEQRVYYLSPDQKQLKIAADDLLKPNGIIGTRDGTTLFVADIEENKTWKYSIADDGSLENKTLFTNLGSDGMTLDEKGNLYLTGDGVTVFNPKGEKILHISVDKEWTANVTFGGKDNCTLFITAMDSVFGLQMNVKGAK